MEDLINELLQFDKNAKVNLKIFNGETCNYDIHSPVVWKDPDSKEILISPED